MKLEKLLENKLIYDGMDDHFYDLKQIQLNDSKLISFIPFPAKMLGELNDEFAARLLEQCPSIEPIEVMKGSRVFKNKNKLTTFGKEADNYLIVYSAEETQPGRYKMEIDYVFSIIN